MEKKKKKCNTNIELQYFYIIKLNVSIVTTQHRNKKSRIIIIYNLDNIILFFLLILTN